MFAIRVPEMPVFFFDFIYAAARRELVYVYA